MTNPCERAVISPSRLPLARMAGFFICYNIYMSESEYQEAEIVDEPVRTRSRTEQFARNRAGDFFEERAQGAANQFLWSLLAPMLLPIGVAVGVFILFVALLFWLLPDWVAVVVLLLLLTPIVSIVLFVYQSLLRKRK